MIARMPKDVYELNDLRHWEDVTREEPVPLRLAVMGDPVEHSRSPQMHNPALESVGIAARYVRLHIRPEELEVALKLLPEKNFIGCNLTIPHKAAALEIVNHVDGHARQMGAVNTVLVDNGDLVGYSTDGPGLVRAVREEFSMDLRDLRVMVLGAGGGAGRSIAVQCAMEGCERLLLVNRTHAKAVDLAKELQGYFQSERLLGPSERLVAVPWEDAILRHALIDVDLIINATCLGMKRSDPPVLPMNALLPHHLVVDTVYAGGRTALLQTAAAVGARGVGGLPMLLHQGALSFEIWFNQPAPLSAMRAGLHGAV